MGEYSREEFLANVFIHFFGIGLMLGVGAIALGILITICLSVFGY